METIPALIPNSLHQEWALLGVLAVFTVALAQGAHHLLTRKQREITGLYLAIREVLAGKFRTTMLSEVRGVFLTVEDHLAGDLIHSGRAEGNRSRFDLLLEGLRDTDPADPEGVDYQRVLRNALAGVLIGRVDTLLLEAENQAKADKRGGGASRLNISFAERTVDDLVYLAAALQLTRRYRSRFYTGQKWAQRLVYLTIPAFAALLTAMLIEAPWGYWLGVVSLGVFIGGAMGAFVAGIIALQAVGWLEEKAEAPDTDKLFQSELSTHD